MKVLFLAHRIPCPPHKGEKIRAFHMIRFLATRHEVHLATIVDDWRDLQHTVLLEPHVRSLVAERIHPRFRRSLALTALLGRRSISSAFFHSRRLQRRIDELIDREGIQAVVCSSSPMAEYVFRSRHLDRLRTMPKLMDLIDVDSVKWREYARISRRGVRWLYDREASCLSALEERIGREFDHLLVVSEAERRCLPSAIDPMRVFAISNGVDLEYFSAGPQGSIRERGANLVFTGVMDYRPNVEGVVWFAERVMPRIRAVVPDTRLYVVGNHPTKPVRRLGDRPGIIVTGYVPDIRGHLSKANVCIAPLKIARGVQNKILEAMAMGRPVVATPQAFEGLDAEAGRDILIAADDAEFANEVIALLRDPERAAAIGRNARVRVEKRYSWATNLQKLDELLRGPESAPGSGGQVQGARLPRREACGAAEVH